MKKLILYNHLGVKEQEFDVFVDGSDFTFEYIIPTCIWLGKILLVDKEPEPEPELSQELKDRIALGVAHVKEVISEPETVGDKSLGDTRVSETEQPKSPETPAKKRAGRKATRRSKRVRNTKTA